MKIMKVAAFAVATLASVCLAVPAFAADDSTDWSTSPYAPDMSLVEASDATIEVGDTYTITVYPKDNGAAENVVEIYTMNEAVLKQTGCDSFSVGGTAPGWKYTFEAVAPGTSTMMMGPRFAYSSLIPARKTVTVTVVDKKEQPAEPTAPDKETKETSTPDKETAGTVESQSNSTSTKQQNSGKSVADIAREKAIADGTWGSEYTTCPACGYHNWTRCDNGYRCDTCGYIIDKVKSAANVKGYVAPSTNDQPSTKYATASQAQAAADRREAAYAAAVKAFQKAIADREAAYLKALCK